MLPEIITWVFISLRNVLKTCCFTSCTHHCTSAPFDHFLLFIAGFIPKLFKIYRDVWRNCCSRHLERKNVSDNDSIETQYLFDARSVALKRNTVSRLRPESPFSIALPTVWNSFQEPILVRILLYPSWELDCTDRRPLTKRKHINQPIWP